MALPLQHHHEYDFHIRDLLDLHANAVAAKQRTLEELDYVFGVTTRRHASFQVKEQFPWWFRRWVLFKKGEPEPQLYYLDDTAIMPSAHENPEKA